MYLFLIMETEKKRITFSQRKKNTSENIHQLIHHSHGKYPMEFLGK